MSKTIFAKSGHTAVNNVNMSSTRPTTLQFLLQTIMLFSFATNLFLHWRLQGFVEVKTDRKET